MMAGNGSYEAAGGGPARHIPVLLESVLQALAPLDGAVIVDGTFGAGGYTEAMLDAGASVIAFDRDPSAITAGRVLEKASEGRLKLIEAPFSQMADLDVNVDGVVLDVGVSSMQLDEADRGFSFRYNGPLDMRMAQSGVSAADVVNTFEVSDLTRIIGILGEERHASRVAKAIVARRLSRPFSTTLDLAEVVEKTVGRSHKDRIHPATRTFQGLRIFINDELRELGRALFAAENLLKAGGRLAVVSFHSLEDRLVKRFIADRSAPASGSRHLPQVDEVATTFEKPARSSIVPDEAECAANPRARSARLRWAVRTHAQARYADYSIFKLPNLPWPQPLKGN